MKEHETQWTKQELKAYVLLYCSNADLYESKEETDYIKSKLQDLNIDKIHAEFDNDNDYQHIQKISSTLKRFKYNKEELEMLVNEIKALFLIDGQYDTLENNLFLGLKRIMYM